MSGEARLTVAWGVVVACGIAAVGAFLGQSAIAGWTLVAMTTASLLLVIRLRGRRQQEDTTRPITSDQLHRAEADFERYRHRRISAATSLEAAEVALNNEAEVFRKYREHDVVLARGQLAHAESDEAAALRALNELRVGAGLAPLSV